MGKTATKTEKCRTCKGKGRYEQKYIEHTIAQRDAGLPGIERSMGVVECFTCKGAGVLPLGYQAAYAKAMREFWCDGKGRCANEDASLVGAFHDDGECAKCDKHHWHCGVCGNIRQVG